MLRKIDAMYILYGVRQKMQAERTMCSTVDIDMVDSFCEDVIALLKEQPEIIRCKDCKNWIPGHITDQDDFIPPKCGKYQQMVGHSSDDFCSLAEQ